MIDMLLTEWMYLKMFSNFDLIIQSTMIRVKKVNEFKLMKPNQ
jgi:hypothetical protein